MTRKLENLFDLPSAEEKSNTDTEEVNESTDSDPELVLAKVNNDIDKIDSALPGVKGLDASDQEMDSLANKATESFDTLMDLGMQVDSRYASEIFSVASNMLGHAITAKNAKLTKKLKMIELQLKKAKLDQDNGNVDELPTANGSILDRNELLRRLTSGHSDSSDANDSKDGQG